jgi:hypothetical protein
VPGSERVEQQRPGLVDDAMKKSNEGGERSSDFGGRKKEVASTARPCPGEKGGLDSEAHVGAELEATAWSATLTRMHWSCGGRAAHTSRGQRE